MTILTDSMIALRNDKYELLHAFDPNIVKIEDEWCNAYFMAKFKVTVNAPTHYLTGDDMKSPKPTDSIVFYVEVPNGYPKTKPRVYYPAEKRLASVNVFPPLDKEKMYASQCTDEWYPKTSSLFLLVEKTVRDIIHDPCVCRYDSMANSSLEDWHRENVKKGCFPTIDPAEIYKKAEDSRLRGESAKLPPVEAVKKPKRQIPPPGIVRKSEV